MPPKINIALVGAGIWARDQHLPAILENKDVTLKAIYSRSRASAEKIAELAPPGVSVYYEDPASCDTNLTALLARADISAVVVCLPILVQLDIVRRCLEAGKHVQSEKPIAGDVDTARRFIKWTRDAREQGTLSRNLVWTVAEEFRLMPACDYMRDEVAKLGYLQTFYAQGYSLMKEDNPFYETAWRRVPGYQGGFLLDGGVHWTATLLHILGPQNRPVRVSAMSNLLRKHLAPVDTLNAVVQLSTGVSGVFAYSAGIEHKAGPSMNFEVVCEHGRATLEPSDGMMKVTVTKGPQDVTVRSFDSTLNSRYEIQTFLKSITRGQEEVEGSPERALDDLSFMQNMLESGLGNGIPKDLDYLS